MLLEDRLCKKIIECYAKLEEELINSTCNLLFVDEYGELFIKTGSMCRGERIAKYNQLMRIEESLKGE